jgi:hypothetical protein
MSQLNFKEPKDRIKGLKQGITAKQIENTFLTQEGYQVISFGGK